MCITGNKMNIKKSKTHYLFVILYSTIYSEVDRRYASQIQQRKEHVIMEIICATVTEFIMSTSQEPLCFLLRTVAVLVGAILCVRCFRHWRVWVPLVGICLLVLLNARPITEHLLVPFAAGLVQTVIWLCVYFIILILPVLLILRWIATGIISYFQRLFHRCNGCAYSQSGKCTQPSVCKGQ